MNGKHFTIALALLPSLAHAGGYGLPVRGVRALSMAGAQVATAEGLDALWYNPSLLDHTAIDLELSMVQLEASYTPASGGPAVENDATPLPNPGLAAVFRVHERLSLAIGAYAPWSPQYSFPEDGAQRYALVKNDTSTVLFLQIAAAVRIGDNLRVGAGLTNVMSHLRQQVVISGYTGLFGSPTDPELDALTEFELEDPFTLTGNVGASYTLGDLDLGISVQLPYSVSGDATARTRLPSSVFFDPTTIEGDQERLSLDFPWMIRAGAAYRPIPRLLLEAAVNVELWSVHDQIDAVPQGITLRDVPGIGDYVLGPHAIDRRMKDTVSVHLGAEGEVLDRLYVRGGTFYETSSFGDETFSLAVFDPDKVGLALGVAWELGGFRVDLAAARIFAIGRDVTTSELRQQNPTNPNQTVVVANGSYAGGMWVAGAKLGYVF